MARDDIFDTQGGVFYVGTSAVIGFSAMAYQNNVIFKVIAAGTSGCYIGGASMAVGLGAGLSGFANGGFLVATSDYINIPLSGNIYFTSAGSTSTISALIGKSAFVAIGATILGGP